MQVTELNKNRNLVLCKASIWVDETYILKCKSHLEASIYLSVGSQKEMRDLQTRFSYILLNLKCFCNYKICYGSLLVMKILYFFRGACSENMTQDKWKIAVNKMTIV